jgi:hypothetical protein
MTAPTDTRMNDVQALPERERTAARLLKSAAKLSFDPQVEVDWDAEQDPRQFYSPPQRVSLYGTDLWDAMTREQQVALSRHEVASIASVGIWFEEILMQMLLRRAYDRDLTRKDIQWGLTEIADECRHSVMFATMISRFGVRNYGVSPLRHALGRWFKTTSSGVQTFAGTMYVEEVLDALQREAMDDESLQPILRQVSRIHVIEEARHISYAREESLREVRRRGPVGTLGDQINVGLVIYFATSGLVHPDVYVDCGLDRRTAIKAARRNPYWRATTRHAASKVVAYFTECGLVGPANRWLLRRAGAL